MTSLYVSEIDGHFPEQCGEVKAFLFVQINREVTHVIFARACRRRTNFRKRIRMSEIIHVFSVLCDFSCWIFARLVLA